MGGEVRLAFLAQELPDFHLRLEAGDELGGIDAYTAGAGVDHLLFVVAAHHFFNLLNF